MNLFYTWTKSELLTLWEPFFLIESFSHLFVWGFQSWANPVAPGLALAGVGCRFPFSFLLFSCLCFYYFFVMFYFPICFVSLTLLVRLILVHPWSDFQPCILLRLCVELWCFHRLWCFQHHHFFVAICLFQQYCSWVFTDFILIVGFY